MLLQEGERAPDDLARPLVIVEGVEAMLSRGMGHQIKGDVLLQHQRHEAVNRLIEVGDIMARSSDEHRRPGLGSRVETVDLPAKRRSGGRGGSGDPSGVLVLIQGCESAVARRQLAPGSDGIGERRRQRVQQPAE